MRQQPICVYNAVDIFSTSRVMVEEVEEEGSSIMMSPNIRYERKSEKKNMSR